MMEEKKEAIQQIAEEIDEQHTAGAEETVDEASHISDYTVPDIEDIQPREEEEQDIFAVLDMNLPEPEEEPEEILRSELGRYDRKDE